MPYSDTNELPTGLKNNLPPHAQSIYKEAFNGAWEQYSNYSSEHREQTSHRVAWSAVKKTYERTGSGRWHKKN